MVHLEAIRDAQVSRRGRLLRLGVGFLFALLTGGYGYEAKAQAEGSEGFQQVREDEGITTWVSDRSGRVLSAVRACVTIHASVWDVLAVLEDVDRACEWTAHCAQMRRVRTVSEHEMLVYARMKAPWPVQDRDVVTRVSVSYGALGELRASIENVEVPEVPTVADVVRMPMMRAHYKFRVLDENRVEVEYQLEVDPGGSLPAWLKRLVSKNLAHDTLGRLRARTGVARARDLYRTRVAELKGLATRSGFASVVESRRATK